MKEHPIIFSSEMVKAILEGRKSQTRRPIKLRDASEDCCWCHGKGYEYIDCENELSGYDYRRPCRCRMPKCPYGQIGDRLWVRENYWCVDLPKMGDTACLLYEDEFERYQKTTEGFEIRPCTLKFGHHPSIHMFHWASRITLEITDIRVERVGQISEEDARKEGVPSVVEFTKFWKSIHGKWEPEKWVWTISFKRI